MAGWLSGWSYRKKITIQENAGESLTDYQIKITVHYGFGTDSDGDIYLGGKCRSDFGDIRFTAGDGEVLLNYWMEEKVDEDYAVFWVKVPSIPANGTTYIYIYYGNPDATYTGDGKATFIKFYDFDTDESGEWVLDVGSWEWDTANGYLKLKTSSAEDRARIKDYTAPTGIAIRTRVYCRDYPDSKGGQPAILFGYQDGSNFYMARPDPYEDQVQLYKKVAGSFTKIGYSTRTINVNTWYILEVAWISASHVKVWLDETLEIDQTTDLESWTSGDVGVRDYYSESWYDWYLVRKYVDPEPSISEIGSEEVQVGWLEGWQYRKKHDINGSTAGGVTDYQIRVKVHYGSGTDDGEDVYLNGKCRSDFGDIRFTADDGVTELTYLLYAKVDGDWAIFYVKIPSIPASPDSTNIYIYYGNSSATTTSDKAGTVDTYEDFESGTFGKFSNTRGSDIFSVVTSPVKQGSYAIQSDDPDTTTSGGRYCDENTFWDSDNKRIVFWMRSDTTSTGTGKLQVRLHRPSTTLRVGVGIEDDGKFWYWNGSDNTTGTASKGAWYMFTVKLRLGDSKYGLEVMDENGNVVVDLDDISMGSYSDDSYDLELYSDKAAVGKGEWDDVIALKYIYPEPSHGTWYAEEAYTVTFSGKVQLPDGTPVANATVIAIDEETNEILATTTSASDGTWSMEIPKGKTVTIVAIPQESDYGGDAKVHIQAS